MADKIYELYKANQGNSLSSDYIQEAFCLMMDSLDDLEPFISDFRVISTDSKRLGEYSIGDRWIKINKKRIENSDMNPNMLALEVIRHEIEHAKHLKSLLDGKEDIESTVISYSLRPLAMRLGIDRFPNLDRVDPLFLQLSIKENYMIDPGERLAEIKAWKYIVNLLKNQRTSDDLLRARSMLYYSYIRGYQDNRYYLDAPTMSFLSKTGMHYLNYWLKNRIDKKDYSFTTRITYGLPITYPEYDQKVLQKVKLRKKINT